MEFCSKCGLKNVPPYVEVDIQVGFIEHYEYPLICEECYENLTEDEIQNFESSKKELPF